MRTNTLMMAYFFSSISLQFILMFINEFSSSLAIINLCAAVSSMFLGMYSFRVGQEAQIIEPKSEVQE